MSAAGRYNLHRLGWKAFEDLGGQILRVVLGETASVIGGVGDAGRDAAFCGKTSARLSRESNWTGSFGVQFKHTSAAGKHLTAALVGPEEAKVKALARANRLQYYLLLTNMRVEGENEALVRAQFEAIKGVKGVLVLGERWIEDCIDAHPRLRRLVPRLYGIGDLAQILATNVYEQSLAVFEDLRHDLLSFVPTESYRKAVNAIGEHGMVVLIGPPASGKSAIAANLCMMFMAEDADVRVLRVETADQFKSAWVPSDQKTVFWVDDVFGETALDSELLRAWSASLPKVEAAVKRGARVVLCTRDYIFRQAQDSLKQTKLRILEDSAVHVAVDSLSTREREQILYNHVKHGDLSPLTRGVLKQHLPAAARLKSFTPELARRLGSRRFYRSSFATWPGIQDFFDRPVELFADVISGLSRHDRAALTLVLMNGNSLPDPVNQEALTSSFQAAFGSSLADVRASLHAMDGSLVKRSIVGTSASWRFHHPSMVDALQALLGTRPDLLEIYIQSADPNKLLAGCSMVDSDHYIFVPQSLYGTFRARLNQGAGVPRLRTFLCYRASDEFLQMLAASGLFPLCLRDESVEESDEALVLAARLDRLGLLPAEEKEAALERARDVVRAECNLTPFEDEDVRKWLGEAFLVELTKEVENQGFNCFSLAFSSAREDLSSPAEFDDASTRIESLGERLCSLPGLTPVGRSRIVSLSNSFQERLGDLKSQSEENESRADDSDGYDSWREAALERENAAGIFSDVDE